MIKLKMLKLPLFTIPKTLQNIKTKNLHVPKPFFGMDIFNDHCQYDDFIILEKNGKGTTSTPVRCDHYICVLTLKGGSTRYVGQKTYTTSSYSLQLLPPELIHSFEDTQDDGEFFLIFFHKNFFTQNIDELLSFHQNNFQPINCDPVEFKRIKGLYEELDKEFKNQKTDFKQVSEHLLTQLLYLIKRKKETKEVSKILTQGEKIADTFLALVQENFRIDKTVYAYSELLGITAKHLGETIKKVLEKSALSIIHDVLIKESQYLLCYSELSIKQIASYLNFENSSDFSRFFKRYEKISPKNYRFHFKK